MKKAALKTYGKIVGVLLSFVAFLTGCDWPFSPPVAEYGVPTADFIIKGKVTDAKSEKPLKNIQIVVPVREYSSYGLDTTYTDSNGEYEIKFQEFPTLDQPFKVVASDIDGENNNGLFKSDTIKTQFLLSDKIQKGTGSWFVGIYQKTNQNFSLKKDEVVAMYGVMGAKYKEDEK